MNGGTLRPQVIFKIVPGELWRAGEPAGRFDGSPVDIRDGYIHFSTAAQVQETAARHFAGQSGLLLVTVDPQALGASLRWEPSRGGELFPHLYAALPLDAVRAVTDLPLDDSGRHVFPDLGRPPYTL